MASGGTYRVGDLVFKEINELSRTYIFPGDNRVTFKNLVGLCVRPSGTHRIDLADGTRVIVNSGWLAIEFTHASGENWRF